MGAQIPPQSLAEVLSMLTPRSKGGMGAEKRKATRIKVESQVTLWRVSNGSPGEMTTALTRDLSYSGVGLLVAQKLAMGDQFILKLPRLKDDPVLVLCQVTFSMEMATGLFGVGAEFMSLLEKGKEAEGKRVKAEPEKVAAAN